MNAVSTFQPFGVWTPVSACGGGVQNPSWVMEPLTVTAINTFLDLGNEVNGSFFMIVVNGMVHLPVGQNPAFKWSGQTITWISNLYSVYPTDDAIAVYSYYPSTP